MDIRGFGTRPVTDKVIEDFLSNFNGKFYRALRQVQPYEVSRWQGFSQEEVQQLNSLLSKALTNQITFSQKTHR